MLHKLKGYRAERKAKLLLMKYGWKVVRAGGSLGEYDLIAFREGKCVFYQVKSTQKNRLYYYGYSQPEYAGFPFRLLVDFGRGVLRVLEPKRTVDKTDGEAFEEYLAKNNS